MTDSVEVAITSESRGQLCSVSVWDLVTGSQLMSYKGGGVCGPNTVALVGSDYIVGADIAKPLLHVWPINSSETNHELRTICPGIILALAVSPDGKYIAAGIAEKIHLWQVGAGKLVCVAARHFQPVTCIRFLEDSSHFVSGGEDGMVAVWNIAELITDEGVRVEASLTFSDHYLAVKDVYVGHGGSGTRIISVSLDGTCRIYDFASGKMLLSLVVDSVNLTSVTADVLESSLFLGCSSGDIVNISLCESPRQVEHHLSEEEKGSIFKGHTNSVTSLSVSQDAVSLLSGSADETVRLWHIESRQCLRVIQHKGSVLNAFITFFPRQMFAEKLKPSLVMHRLQRVNDQADSHNFSFEIMPNCSRMFVPFRNSYRNINESEVACSEGVSTVSNEELSEKCLEIEDLKKKNLLLYQLTSKKILGSISDNNRLQGGVIPPLVNVDVTLPQVELNSVELEPLYKLTKRAKKNKKASLHHDN